MKVHLTRRRGSARHALVASVLAAGLLVSACSGQQAAGDADKVLTLGIPAPAVTYDPAKAVTDSLWITQLAYDPLIYRGKDGSLQPRLAKSWSYLGADRRIFELKLQPNAKFSDGTPLTAEVVKKNLQYHAKVSRAATKIAMFETIEVVDELTVHIHLSEAHPALPDLFTAPKFVGDLASGPAIDNPSLMSTKTYGAGPYTLDPAQTVSKSTYTFVPNPHYWNPKGIHYDKVVVKVIENANTALSALKTQEIDAMQGDFTTAAAAEKAGLQVAHTPRQWFGVIIADADGKLVPALKDVRVRQALNYAVDRQKIATGLLGEYGAPTEQIVMPGQAGYSDDNFYGYDPDRAKTLLREAGYPNGFTLPVATTPKRGLDLVVQALADDWKAIGIDVKQKTEANDGNYSEAQTAAELPVFGVSFGSDGELHNMGPTLYQGSKTFNPFKIKDPQLDALRDEAANTADDAARGEVYKKLVRHLVEAGRYVPVVAGEIFYYANDKVAGLQVSTNAQQASPTDFHPAK